MDTDDTSFHFGFKVVVVGDAGVGKSTLVQNHTGQKDVRGGYSQKLDSSSSGSGEYSRTDSVGVQFYNHKFDLKNLMLRVQLWDSPGADHFFKLTTRFCAGASAAVYVFDITQPDSFERVADWMAEVERSAKIPHILIGNKSDKQSQRKVTFKQAQEFAFKHDMGYFETCAVTSKGVTEAFVALYQNVISSIPEPADPSVLIRTGIRVGRKLAESSSYRQQLYSDMKNTTEKVDWL